MSGCAGFNGYDFDNANDRHMIEQDAYLSNWHASNAVEMSPPGGSGVQGDFDYRLESTEPQGGAGQDMEPTSPMDRSRSTTSRPTSSAGSGRTPRKDLCTCGKCPKCKNRRASAKCRANGQSNKVRIPQLEAENRVLKRQLQDAEKRCAELAEIKAKNALLEEQVRSLQEQHDLTTHVEGENRFMREMFRNCVCAANSLVAGRSVDVFDVNGSQCKAEPWEYKPSINHQGISAQGASIRTDGQAPAPTNYLPHPRQSIRPTPPPYYTQDPPQYPALSNSIAVDLREYKSRPRTASLPGIQALCRPPPLAFHQSATAAAGNFGSTQAQMVQSRLTDSVRSAALVEDRTHRGLATVNRGTAAPFAGSAFDDAQDFDDKKGVL